MNVYKFEETLAKIYIDYVFLGKISSIVYGPSHSDSSGIKNGLISDPMINISSKVLLFQYYRPTLLNVSPSDIISSLRRWAAKFNLIDLGAITLVEIRIKRYPQGFYIIETVYKYSNDYATYFDFLPKEIFNNYLSSNLSLENLIRDGHIFITNFDILTKLLLTGIKEIYNKIDRSYADPTDTFNVITGSYNLNIDINKEKQQVIDYLGRLVRFIIGPLNLLSQDSCASVDKSLLKCESFKSKLLQYLNNAPIFKGIFDFDFFKNMLSQAIIQKAGGRQVTQGQIDGVLSILKSAFNPVILRFMELPQINFTNEEIRIMKYFGILP